MAKREAQTFEWKSIFSEAGIYQKLGLLGRDGGPADGVVEEFNFGNYPAEIAEQIKAAGHKAVFQQRTSQCETDEERLQYWEALHNRFIDGDWEREGGARGAPVIAAWIEAAAASKSCTPGEFQASWSRLEKVQRDKIKANCEKKFADEIEAIKAARKQAPVDLADLA